MAEYNMFCLLFFAFVLMSVYSMNAEIYVSNLNPQCMRCLCVASSGCPIEPIGCSEGHCGPFQISTSYWLDAIQGTQYDAFAKDESVFVQCTNNYKCAARVVKYYIAKFAKDCNGDGLTTCEDYLMINYNGGYGCEKPLHRNPNANGYLKRFANCTANYFF